MFLYHVLHKRPAGSSAHKNTLKYKNALPAFSIFPRFTGVIRQSSFHFSRECFAACLSGSFTSRCPSCHRTKTISALTRKQLKLELFDAETYRYDGRPYDDLASRCCDSQKASSSSPSSSQLCSAGQTRSHAYNT